MADNTTINSGTGGDTIATDDISGVKHQRVKVEWGADGSATDTSAAAPLPTFNQHTGRTMLHYWANGAAAGSSGTETAITLTRSPSAGGATNTATSFTPTNAKRYRLTSLTFASRGHSTATAQVTTFNLRVNTGGAVTTSSNIWLSARTATPATALAWDRVSFVFGDDGPELAGDGTLQIGVTAAATYTTNAPTWDVVMTVQEF